MPMQRRVHIAAENFGPEWDAKWIKFFEDEKLSLISLHRGLDDVFSHDLVPKVEIMTAVLHACRRLNCYGTAIRMLEAVREKVDSKADYYYLVDKLQPILDEHGIDTPEALGFSPP